MNANSLDALRDIHLPAPPAPWLLPDWLAAAGMLAFFLAFFLAFWYARRLWRRRALRAALRALDELVAAHARERDAARLAGGLSRLLRRHAMARYPQSDVAGLTGKDWLRFLDAHGGNGAFSHGAGAVLEALPYRPGGEMDAAQAAALIAAARHWLKANPR
ncbi:MAG: DUF4381 domain-containing protein [Bacillota bacterium]